VQRIRDYYPFTAPGTLVIAVGIYLLGYAFSSLNGEVGEPSLARINLYAFWFSAAALIVVSLLTVFAYLVALRLRFSIVTWQAKNLTARTETEHAIGVSPSPGIPLFRIHFRIRGTFQCGRNIPLFVSSENSADPEGLIHVPFYFPLCGILQAEGTLYLRDLLGFVRIRLQPPIAREIAVKPPLFPVPEALRVDVTSSPEPSRRQQQSDEEKYYMREYEPGDRMKDINWKASMRIFELVTRISPASPEPSRLLRIELRPYSSIGETPLSLMHLNYVKSWVLSFISTIHSRHPEYRFHVKAGTHEQFVEEAKDIELLGQAFASVHFQAEASASYKPNDELFIFTTAFDHGLPNLLASRSLAKTHLFRTAADTAGEKEIRQVRMFHAAPGLAIPGLKSSRAFIFSAIPRKIPRVPARVNGFYMEEKLKLAII